MCCVSFSIIETCKIHIKWVMQSLSLASESILVHARVNIFIHKTRVKSWAVEIFGRVSNWRPQLFTRAL